MDTSRIPIDHCDTLYFPWISTYFTFGNLILVFCKCLEDSIYFSLTTVFEIVKCKWLLSVGMACHSSKLEQ